MSAIWWIPLENALGMLRGNFFGESQNWVHLTFGYICDIIIT
jgi:hypothetical protein